MLLGLLLLVFAFKINSNKLCPCNNAYNQQTNKINVCLSHFPSSLWNNSTILVDDYVWINSSATHFSNLVDELKCHVHLIFYANKIRKVKREICPNNCDPIPTVNIPWNEILSSTISLDYPITCSLTLAMILRRKHRIEYHRSPDLSELLLDVVSVVVRECQEKPQQRLSYHNPQPKNGKMYNKVPIGKRKVESVIIWIGTAANRQLIIDQSLVLRNTSYYGPKAVIGWAATDTLYPCNDSTTKCTERGGNNKYRYLPPSAINFMKPGWRCAQRRPLRSLTHVLSLFDPLYIILLDDDTYLNYDLLMQRHGRLLLHDMRYMPYYMGEYQGRTGSGGHLSTGGIFAGGSGYIIGRKVLTRLVRKEVYFFGNEKWPGQSSEEGGNKNYYRVSDRYRSQEQIAYLSVLQEGIALAQTSCVSTINNNRNRINQQHGRSNNTGIGNTVLLLQRSSNVGDESTDRNNCILSMIPRVSASNRYNNSSNNNNNNNSNAFVVDSAVMISVPIAVRLINFCTNLMANEHTCQHSDHSLGRCLLYGAHAIPLGVACHSTAAATAIDSNKISTNSKTASPIITTSVGPTPVSLPLHSNVVQQHTDRVVSVMTSSNSIQEEEEGWKYMDEETVVVNQIRIGMCFTTPVCDPMEQITCHRYKATTTSTPQLPSATSASAVLSAERKQQQQQQQPSQLDSLKDVHPFPIRTSNSKGYYRVYSSIYNA